MTRKTLVVAALLLGWTPLHARAGELCKGPTSKELAREVRDHLFQTMMMDQKFQYELYGKGPLPPPAFAEPKDVVAFLEALAPRRTAVLYQLHEKGAVCTWLVSSKGVERSLAQVDPARYTALRPRLLAALDVAGRSWARAPRRGTEEFPPAVPKESKGEVLAEASAVLFPKPIATKLVDEGIDTLVVIPSADLGSIPFAAIPVAGMALVERASVLIAPTFAAFLGPPRAHRQPLSPAVVVGDPAYGKDPDFVLPALPGARAEAAEVGKLVGSTPLLGADATRAAVVAAIRGASGGPGLVYLATHGRADPVNPLDQSVLWVAGGRWTAREISTLDLSAARPLVVLSACQTGLGKSFQPGTIGLARAFAHAGASSVVMSLWQVDDEATRRLMTGFLASAKEVPPDVALRRAMLELRRQDSDPAHWASFAVYGVPASLPGSAAPAPPRGKER